MGPPSHNDTAHHHRDAPKSQERSIKRERIKTEKIAILKINQGV